MQNSSDDRRPALDTNVGRALHQIDLLLGSGQESFSREELLQVREALAQAGGGSTEQLTAIVPSSGLNANSSSAQVNLPLGLALAGASGISMVSEAAASTTLIRDLVQHEQEDVQLALMEMVMGRHALGTGVAAAQASNQDDIAVAAVPTAHRSVGVCR